MRITRVPASQIEELAAFEVLTYPQALARLGVPYLFDENETDDMSEYEREELAYIWYVQGDVVLRDNLSLHLEYGSYVLAIDGNLRVPGHLDMSFYVTGDVDVDYLTLLDTQVCLGTETVRYLQTQMAEDDNTVMRFRRRLITAPVFLCHYHDPRGHDYSPRTALFAQYEAYLVEPYQPERERFFRWHDWAYALQDDLYDPLEEGESNQFYLKPRKIYERLRDGGSIYREGFDFAAMPWHARSVTALHDRKDWREAYLCARQAAQLAPGFAAAFITMGLALNHAGDWQSAERAFKQADAVLSPRVEYQKAWVGRWLESFAARRQRGDTSAPPPDWIDQGVADL